MHAHALPATHTDAGALTHSVGMRSSIGRRRGGAHPREGVARGQRPPATGSRCIMHYAACSHATVHHATVQQCTMQPCSSAPCNRAAVQHATVQPCSSAARSRQQCSSATVQQCTMQPCNMQPCSSAATQCAVATCGHCIAARRLRTCLPLRRWPFGLRLSTRPAQVCRVRVRSVRACEPAAFAAIGDKATFFFGSQVDNLGAEV
jgi:hypothetical protein